MEVLLLCDYRPEGAATVIDHIDALCKDTGHRVRKLSLLGNLPDTFDLERFGRGTSAFPGADLETGRTVTRHPTFDLLGKERTDRTEIRALLFHLASQSHQEAELVGEVCCVGVSVGGDLVIPTLREIPCRWRSTTTG